MRPDVQLCKGANRTKNLTKKVQQVHCLKKKVMIKMKISEQTYNNHLGLKFQHGRKFSDRHSRRMS